MIPKFLKNFSLFTNFFFAKFGKNYKKKGFLDRISVAKISKTKIYLSILSRACLNT